MLRFILPSRRSGLLGFAGLMLLLWAEKAAAQSAAVPAPLSGEAWQRKLTETVGVSWSGATLGDVVASLSRNTRVCIWLDRRVDLDRRVEWSSRDRSLRDTIEQLAATQDLGVAWIGSVAYIGPKGTTAGLPAIVARRNAEASALPAVLRTKLTVSGSLHWSDLTEPRGLFIRLAAEAGLRIANETAMPHDLWSEKITPPLTLVERLSLIAAGFDLTYRLNPATQQLTLEPWPTEALNAAPKPLAGATTTAKPAPSAPIQGRQAYTLRVKDVPLAKLIEVLRERHGLKIRIDEKAIVAAGLSLDRITAVDVQQATLAALLEQAAAPLGLTARQDGEEVVIEPKK